MTRGISLHVGVNRVDPAHYDGWDGALAGCENDARAMLALARREGFEGETLLSEAATREAFVNRVAAAAAELEAGDTFLLSVSAHGGQLPDLNGDEVGDGDLPADEALLLHDFMIADDELYAHWGEFRAGVRVLLVSDTCHSGSMVRADPFGLGGDPARADGRRLRFAPRRVTSRTFLRNRPAYLESARRYAHIREDIVGRPLPGSLDAAVLGLAACRDEQYAVDGDRHGAFTEALLAVWAEGRFDGDYRALIERVGARLDDPAQTPCLKRIGAEDAGFVAGRPFTPGSCGR